MTTEQITGDLNAAENALLQVMQRLRANIFETDESSSAFSMPTPYATSTDLFKGQTFVNRNNRRRNSGYSAYSGGYSSKNLPPNDSCESYDEPQVIWILIFFPFCVRRSDRLTQYLT